MARKKCKNHTHGVRRLCFGKHKSTVNRYRKKGYIKCNRKTGFLVLTKKGIGLLSRQRSKR
jgi:hypothetical protein